MSGNVEDFNARIVINGLHSYALKEVYYADHGNEELVKVNVVPFDCLKEDKEWLYLIIAGNPTAGIDKTAMQYFFSPYWLNHSGYVYWDDSNHICVIEDKNELVSEEEFNKMKNEMNDRENEKKEKNNVEFLFTELDKVKEKKKIQITNIFNGITPPFDFNIVELNQVTFQMENSEILFSLKNSPTPFLGFKFKELGLDHLMEIPKYGIYNNCYFLYTDDHKQTMLITDPQNYRIKNVEPDELFKPNMDINKIQQMLNEMENIYLNIQKISNDFNIAVEARKLLNSFVNPGVVDNSDYPNKSYTPYQFNNQYFAPDMGLPTNSFGVTTREVNPVMIAPGFIKLTLVSIVNNKIQGHVVKDDKNNIVLRLDYISEKINDVAIVNFLHHLQNQIVNNNNNYGANFYKFPNYSNYMDPCNK